MSASGSKSEEESSQHSKSESERASSESGAEAAAASSAEEEPDEDSEAGPSGAVGPAPPQEPEPKSVEQLSNHEQQPTKKRNRNPDKWVLLQEWDAAQVTLETIEREKLAIVTKINIAAGLDKFPVHKV